MDDRDLRQLFQQAPGDAPPPSFGLEDVQAASRRATARRRVQIAMASAAAVLVLAGGGIFATIGTNFSGGNSGNSDSDIAAEAPHMRSQGDKQPSARDERPSDGGPPPGRESSKQGGDAQAVPERSATRTARCTVVDRKLATALAGELPVDPSSEPVGADLACPSGVTAAAYQVQDGANRGVISIARVPARMARTADSLNPDDLPDASATASDGSVFVVASRADGGAPPYASDLLRIAEGVAAAW